MVKKTNPVHLSTPASLSYPFKKGVSSRIAPISDMKRRDINFVKTLKAQTSADVSVGCQIHTNVHKCPLTYEHSNLTNNPGLPLSSVLQFICCVMLDYISWRGDVK